MKKRHLTLLPNFGHGIRELVETGESFAALTREYDNAADEEERLAQANVPTKAEKSRKRRSMIEKDIVACLQSSARIL